MKLNVLKNNSLVGTYDLSADLAQDPDINFQQIFIGRDDDCHVVLNDPKVSRKHAKIVWRDKKYFVEKCSAMGNLEVNGQRVSSVQLKNGDVITVDAFALLADEIKEKEATLTEPVSAAVEPAASTKGSFEIDLSEAREMVEQTPVEAQKEKSQRTVSLSEFEETGMEDAPEDAASPEQADLEFPDASQKDEADEASLNNQNQIESSFSAEMNNDSSEGTEPDVEGVDFSDDSDEGFNDGEGFDNDGESDYPVEEFDDDKTNVFTSFADFELEISGEFCEYDKYSIKKNEIKIGRDGDKCEIVLNEEEVSSVHAVIRKKNVTCVLEDLNSSNGTILNGSRINEAQLSNLDEFIIGSTTFTFHIKSELLDEEKDRLMPVDTNQEVEVEEVVEVAMEFGDENVPAEFEGGEGMDFGDEPKAADGKESLMAKFSALPTGKKLIYGGIALLLVFLMTEEPEPKKKTKKKKDKDYKLAKEKKEQEKKGAISSKYDLKNLSAEKREFLESSYQLSKTLYDQGKYKEAILELEKIFSIVPEYKQATQRFDLAKQGLAALEEIEKKKREEIERKIRNKKIKDLVVKAKKAVEERKATLAENFFQRIIELDPENFDVPQMKLELENWKQEIERKALLEAQKKAERQRKVDALKPGKAYYLKQEWYKAILKLESFLRIKDMDEDLIKEGSKMLKESRANLDRDISPMLGKARSLKEGQDLKGAYETYGEILKINPSNIEALDNMGEIREALETRSKRIYRDAIISESLSQFKDAKQKFQEVQQISPSDSDYYKKATLKLKDYLE